MVWPEPGEALDRTVAAEQAIEDLHSEAFARWAPYAAAVALPVLATGVALPPDLAALTTAASIAEWAVIAEAVIVTGVSLVWAAAVVEAMQAQGIPLPAVDLDAARPAVAADEVVWRIVDRAVTQDREELAAADRIVESSPPLREARNAVLDVQRANTERTVTAVRDKVGHAITDVGLNSDGSIAVEAEREAVAETLTPGSTALRDIARSEGYEAAGVLNDAAVTAAWQANTEFGEALEKCWIATLDGKTRPSHWAADGQRVPLESHFTVGGEKLFVPGDQTASPAEWKNCRCRVGILAADEPLPDEFDRHTERLDGRDSVVVNRGGRTQAEEIERRRRAGNVRARDTSDGVGRIASVSEETEMADQPELSGNSGELPDEGAPDFAAELTALVAASAVAEPRLRTYDPRLFEDPKLTGPTFPSMNNETGRIYGHLAEWGHIIRGGRDVTPRNRNGYRNFHTSQVTLDNGKQLSVGRLTVQGGHASTERGVTASSARAHYDDVTKAFGLVRVGEDRFGIWFSGVPAPGVDPDVFQQGMTAQLSGDWRDCEGHPLDMIAAHAVNSPGFPIYSAQTGPEGRELALVASLGPVRGQATPTHVLASVEELKAAVGEVLDERERAAELAARRDAALTAAYAAVGEPPAPLTPAERVEELLAINALTAGVSTMPAQFKKYWLAGAGAAKIAWGTEGSYRRCLRLLQAKVVENGQKLSDSELHGACANLYHEATGRYPGKR